MKIIYNRGDKVAVEHIHPDDNGVILDSNYPLLLIVRDVDTGVKHIFNLSNIIKVEE